MKTKEYLVDRELWKFKICRRIGKFGDVILLAVFIAWIFFNIDSGLALIISNISWLFITFSTAGIIEANNRLKFLKCFDDGTEFPDDF